MDSVLNSCQILFKSVYDKRWIRWDISFKLSKTFDSHCMQSCSEFRKYCYTGFHKLATHYFGLKIRKKTTKMRNGSVFAISFLFFYEFLYLEFFSTWNCRPWSRSSRTQSTRQCRLPLKCSRRRASTTSDASSESPLSTSSGRRLSSLSSRWAFQTIRKIQGDNLTIKYAE